MESPELRPCASSGTPARLSTEAHLAEIRRLELASRPIFALSILETEQPLFALAVNFPKDAFGAGILALTVRWMAVMAKPSATLSSVTATFVSMPLAVSLASFKINDNATEKQSACAPPISS